jgi:hypothetical protein
MNGCGLRKNIVCVFNVGLAGLGLGLNLMPGVVMAETSGAKPSVQANGIYLYGEANAVNQVGKGYLIFQQSGHQLVGAMYSPQSEYTCFIGKRAAANIDVQPFEPGLHPSLGQDVLQVSLSGLHPIAQVGLSERQVLTACQQEAIALQSSSAVTFLPHP